MTSQSHPSSANPIVMRVTLLMIAGLTAFNGTSGIFVVPSVARDMDVPLDVVQWVATITLMLGAVSSPIISRLGDDFHRRRYMLAILVTVALASLICAMAPNFQVLLAGRALQGACVALIPLSVATARAALPPEGATQMAALITTATTIGMGVVYVVTGVVIELGSYRGVFWLEAGFALFVMAMLLRLPPSSLNTPPQRIELPGTVLLTIGLVSLLLGITLGPHIGFLDSRTIALFAGSLGTLAGWAIVEWRSASPLVNVRLVVHRVLLGATLGTFLLGIALYTVISLNSRYLQQPVNGHERSLITIGIVLFPISLGAFAGMKIRPRLMHRWPLQVVVAGGALMMGLAIVWLGMHRVHLWEFSLAVFLVGLAGSMTFSVMPQILVKEVPPAETAAASSMNQVMRLIGAAIGSTVSVAILAALSKTPDGATADGDAYTVAYFAGAACTVVAAAVALIMLRGERVFESQSPEAAGTESVS